MYIWLFSSVYNKIKKKIHPYLTPPPTHIQMYVWQESDIIYPTRMWNSVWVCSVYCAVILHYTHIIIEYKMGKSVRRRCAYISLKKCIWRIGGIIFAYSTEDKLTLSVFVILAYVYRRACITTTTTTNTTTHETKYVYIRAWCIPPLMLYAQSGNVLRVVPKINIPQILISFNVFFIIHISYNNNKC